MITGVLFYQAIWINKITWLKSWSYILINSLVIAEFFLVISFLPTSFYVNGIILATVYYFILGLSRSYLLDKFEKKIIKKYIAVVLIVLIIVLGTARWL